MIDNFRFHPNGKRHEPEQDEEYEDPLLVPIVSVTYDINEATGNTQQVTVSVSFRCLPPLPGSFSRTDRQAG